MCLQYETDFTTLTDPSSGPSSFSQTLIPRAIGKYKRLPVNSSHGQVVTRSSIALTLQP